MTMEALEPELPEGLFAANLTKSMILLLKNVSSTSDLAERFLSATLRQGSEISGRPIDVHYSLPRDDQKQGGGGGGGGGDERDKNQQYQGCLIVTLKDSRQPIDDNEVQRKSQQFGDVKSVTSASNRMDQRYVEYYNTRNCDEAFDRLRHQGLQDGTMDATTCVNTEPRAIACCASSRDDAPARLAEGITDALDQPLGHFPQPSASPSGTLVPFTNSPIPNDTIASNMDPPPEKNHPAASETDPIASKWPRRLTNQPTTSETDPLPQKSPYHLSNGPVASKSNPPPQKRPRRLKIESTTSETALSPQNHPTTSTMAPSPQK
ncbi:hypothetical protein BU15DRAFT_71133 [Melanogaster broomeanus]|nr:hypothetical protein BU15DRAFT_71133 [Melanogaster broomeanus]